MTITAVPERSLEPVHVQKSAFLYSRDWLLDAVSDNLTKWRTEEYDVFKNLMGVILGASRKLHFQLYNFASLEGGSFLFLLKKKVLHVFVGNK